MVIPLFGKYPLFDGDEDTLWDLYNDMLGEGYVLLAIGPITDNNKRMLCYASMRTIKNYLNKVS